MSGGYPGRKNTVVPGGGDLFLQVLKQHPEILQQMLSTVLNVIMFEDCRNQWSMSRPLLGLILLNEEVGIFHYKNYVKTSQKFYNFTPKLNIYCYSISISYEKILLEVNQLINKQQWHTGLNI